MRHDEFHRSHRVGWLRAAVLGANDGIVSTASLILGVAAAGADRSSIWIAGIAGLVAGAMSMAAGEYVSVSSQADTEMADLARETRELETQPEKELQELTSIFVERGLDEPTAAEVAEMLTKKDALAAHAREELAISNMTGARPIQAAIYSAVTFAIGAALPLVAAGLAPATLIMWAVGAGSLVFLALLGSIAARAGGAPVFAAAVRVTFWGALAMLLTSGVGALFGIAV